MAQDTKKTEEALAEIYRNAQLALQSISNILPESEDMDVRKELTSQYEKYEHFSAQASILAKDMGIELKEPNPMKKMMMWGSIKMNTLTDNSRSHIADMMVQGTVMGITSLKTSLSDMEYPKDEEICGLAEELLSLEEKFEQTLKEYL